MRSLPLDLWLMRRGARPGTIAAVTFLAHPLGKIGLERLRGDSVDTTGVMTMVVVGIMVVNVIIASWFIVRRRLRASHAAAPLVPAASECDVAGVFTEGHRVCS